MNLLPCLRLVFLATVVSCASPALADAVVLTERKLHLGQPGQWEWDSYKDMPVDATELVVKFPAQRNATPHTLRLWQRDVKLGWNVFLNEQKIGSLVTAETAMETLIQVEPGKLKDGENVLRITGPAAPAVDDIEVGPISLVPRSAKEMLEEASLEILVRDEGGDSTANGAGLPCRLTITRRDGTLQPVLAEPVETTATRTGVVYVKDGRATLRLPAGNYVIHAGRGFEWSVAKLETSLKPGANGTQTLTLRREVPTEGWVAVDSHIHTLTYSRHGDAKLEERMLTIAGEGIELAVATDHNHHADYATAVAALGLQETFTPVVGNEVTTKRGHFNAFPVEPGAPVVDATQEDWSVLLPAIRKTPGVQVITLNHPRDLHSGFIPFGPMQFHPGTGKHRQADALEVDAVEVITSAAMQSDILLLYRDWFALLNRGHRISAIGSSDSHDVNRFILGQGRTYVAVPDAQPGKLDLNLVWRSYREGRLLVSLGLLAQIRVNDRFTVGDTAVGLGLEGKSTVKVEASVYGPAWVQADHVGLYENGVLIREQKLEDAHRAGEKARITWEIPRRKHDTHLAVIATGPGVTAPYWEIPRPYQASSKTFTPRVIGSTNPVWLDADGDGHFSAAAVYARRLVEQFGKEPEALAKALEGYDKAVRAQVGG